MPVFGANYEPWVVMILPPGGFLTLGFLLLGLNSWQARRVRLVRAGTAGGPEGALPATREAA
jgi:electron transport complex protein RnfE